MEIMDKIENIENMEDDIYYVEIPNNKRFKGVYRENTRENSVF